MRSVRKRGEAKAATPKRSSSKFPRSPLNGGRQTWTSSPVPCSNSIVQCAVIALLVCCTAVFYLHGSASNTALVKQQSLCKQQSTQLRECAKSVSDNEAAHFESMQRVSALESALDSATAQMKGMVPMESVKEKNAANQKQDAEDWIKRLQRLELSSLRYKYQIDSRKSAQNRESNKLRILLETVKFGDILFEIAEIHLMPHTIRFFLELVEAGYWNGCHFHRNAGHVIQATCNRRNEPTAESSLLFEDSWKSGHSVVFQEYSEQYSHRRHTVGLAGRPGGPSFYVSTVDNVRNHGPGGQDSMADPCFARAVRGKATIDKIHAIAPDPNDQMQGLKVEDWVQFRRFTVLTDRRSVFYNTSLDEKELALV